MRVYPIRIPNYPQEDEIIKTLEQEDLLAGDCSHASILTHVEIFKAGFGSGWSDCVDELEERAAALNKPRRGWMQDDGWGE